MIIMNGTKSLYQVFFCSMPYNEAVVHECVRHFMGRTFGVPHRALKDTTLCGYFVPEVSNSESN